MSEENDKKTTDNGSIPSDNNGGTSDNGQNPFGGMDLSKLLNLGGGNNDNKKKREENRKNKTIDEREKQISADIADTVNDGVDKINEQIRNANTKLKSNVDIYNNLLEERDKIVKAYGEKLLTTIADEYKKNSGKNELEDKQLELSVKQGVIQNDGANLQRQIQYVGSGAEDLSRKEQNGDENPLLSSHYLQLVAELTRKALERDQQLQQAMLKKESGALQAKSQKFQQQQANLMKQKAAKSQKLSNELQNNNNKQKQASGAIDKIYNDEFKTINSRYKKILGLQSKYKDKIREAESLKEKEELIDQLQEDIENISKASKEDLQEETNKFNDKGERVETKKEKKEREKKEEIEEKERKKKRKERLKNNNLQENEDIQDEKNDKKEQTDNNNHGDKGDEENIENNADNSNKEQEQQAKKIIDDKEQNGDIDKQDDIYKDKEIKDAFQAQKKEKSEEQNLANKMQISGIGATNDIKNNTNVGLQKKKSNNLAI